MIPERLLEELTKEEYEILSLLSEGKSVTEIAKELDKGEKEIESVVNDLKSEKRKVIIGNGPIINPLKVWNDLFFIFLKAELAPPVVPMAEKYPQTWGDLIKRIEEQVKGDAFLEKRIFQVFCLQGTEWDILMIVGANRKEELKKVIESIVKGGFITRAWSFSADDEFWIFRPFSIINEEELKDGRKHLGELYSKFRE